MIISGAAKASRFVTNPLLLPKIMASTYGTGHKSAAGSFLAVSGNEATHYGNENIFNAGLSTASTAKKTVCDLTGAGFVGAIAGIGCTGGNCEMTLTVDGLVYVITSTPPANTYFPLLGAFLKDEHVFSSTTDGWQRGNSNATGAVHIAPIPTLMAKNAPLLRFEQSFKYEVRRVGGSSNSSYAGVQYELD